MAKISDILAKATSKLKGVGASIADAVAPATSSILAKDAPTASTFGGSGVSLFEAKPGQKVETIVDSATKGLYNIGADFADKEEKYLSTPESDKSIIDKALYAVEKVPFTIGAGVDQAINAPTNTQKIEGVTNAAMGLLSLRPDVAAFQVGREVLLSQDMQKGIQSGIDTIMSYSDPTLKAMGVTDENLQSTKNIIYNIGALLLSGKVAPKVGGKVSSAVKKSGGSVAKQSTAGFMANATVQSAPDIIGQITNYLTNGGSEEDAISTLAPTILNTLGAIPLGKKSAPSKTPRTDKMNQIKIDAAKDTSVPDFNEFVAKENPTKEQIKTIENGMKVLESDRNPLLDEDFKALPEGMKNYVYSTSKGSQGKLMTDTSRTDRMNERKPKISEMVDTSRTDRMNQANIENAKAEPMADVQSMLDTLDGETIDIIKSAQDTIAKGGNPLLDAGFKTLSNDLQKYTYNSMFSEPAPDTSYNKTQRRLDYEAANPVVQPAEVTLPEQGDYQKSQRRINYEEANPVTLPEEVTLPEQGDYQKSQRRINYEEANPVTLPEEVTLPESGDYQKSQRRLDYEEANPVKQEMNIEDTSMDSTQPDGVKRVTDASKPHLIENPKFELTLGGMAAKARGILNTNTTIKALLNNVIVKDATGKGEKLANYVTRLKKTLLNDVARSVMKDVPVTNEEIKNAGFRDFTGDEMIGGLTPEGMEVSYKNLKEYKKTYDSIKDEQLGATTVDIDDNNRNSLQKAMFVYDLVKHDVEKTNKLFTEQQQALLSRIDAQEKVTYNTFKQYLIDRGVLNPIDATDDYIRFVMGVIGYDRLKNLAGAPQKYVVTNGNKTLEFPDLLSAQRYMNVQNGMKGKAQFSFDEDTAAKLNSLGKDKGGAQLDMFRTHGAFNRLLSYAESIGKLESDYQIGNIIRAGAEDSGQAGKYLQAGLKGDANANVFADILGLNKVEGNTPAKVAGWLGNAGTVLQMAGNTASLGAQAVSTILKVVPRLLAPDGLKIISSLPVLKTKAVKNWLANEGFNTAYEIMPLSNKNISSKALGVAMELGTGNILVENPAKSWIALGMAKKVLADNGYGKVKSDDIPVIWEKFKQEKPEDYRLAHDSIIDNTNWISDVSSMAKLNLGGEFTRNLLGKIKTYAIDQLASTNRDLVGVVDMIRKGGGDDAYDKKFGKGAAQRLAIGAGISTALFMKGYYEFMDKVDEQDDDTEEEKEMRDQMAKEYALYYVSKFASPSIINDAATFVLNGKILPSYQGLVGSVSESPIGLGADILSTLYTSTTAPEGKKYYELVRGLTNVAKGTGAGRSQLNYWGTPENAPGFANKTRYLYDKASDTKDTFDKLTGSNPDAVMESFMRKEIGKVTEEDKGFIQGIVGGLYNYLANSSIVRDVSEMNQEFTTDKTNIYTGYDAFDISNNIVGKKYTTVDDILKSVLPQGEQADIASIKDQFIKAVMNREGGSLKNTNTGVKENVPMELQLKPVEGSGTYEENLMNALNGNLRVDNPRLYTDIISVLAQIKNPKMTGGELPQFATTNTINDWKNGETQSNPLIDGMVADSLGKAALSDTLSAAMAKQRDTLSELSGDMMKKKFATNQQGADFFESKLKTLDTIYGVAKSVGISENALPADAVKWNSILTTMRQSGLEGLVSSIGQKFPNLYDALYKGLTLRGEVPTTPSPTPQGTGTGNLPISQVVQQSAEIPTSTTPITEPYTPQKWTELKQNWKGAFGTQPQTSSRTMKEPKLKKTSLSEMLAKSRQSKK